jgi:hypothetical protein
MKKRLYIISLFITLFSCYSCSKKENNPNIIKVEIYYVFLYTTTFTNVDCDKFYDCFSDSMDSLTITDKKILSEFEKEISCLKLANSYTKQPDVRIIMKVFYKNHKEDLCLDSFVIEKNGKLYLFSDKLKKLLNKVGVVKKIW